MKFYRRTVAVLLAVFLVFVPLTPKVSACGPDVLIPVFVFHESPDVPFSGFVRGQLGIVQPTFGRKTLVISYRYLNGGSFTTDEQHELVDALKGKGPDENSDAAIKAWVEARKTVLKNEEQSPDIYDERSSGGYQFFPNCSKNAFEVATATLKDRVTSYGADDPNVQEWLRGQDVVFENCDGGSVIPAEVGPAGPAWLRKDRDYQVAAAYFYSVNFHEARVRFARIAEDGESPWQQTANYLVARTLVRDGSLSTDDQKRRALYEQAESYLLNLQGHAGKFQNASRKLLGLVKFRLHPEERVGELARVLEHEAGNENLRQDLIDYSWLLDNFVERARKEEEERQKRLKPPEDNPDESTPDEKYLAVQRGELIQVWFTPLLSNGQLDYEKARNWYFKPEVTFDQVLEKAETDFARKLSPAETAALEVQHKSSMKSQRWYASPNRKIGQEDYEGCLEECRKVPLKLLPAFMRIDPLNDWILTFQSDDPGQYTHALRRWKETHDTAWLIAAIAKADNTSRGALTLIREAEQIPKETPAYPTVAYHLIRLRFEAGRKVEAKKLADDVISNLDALPKSAQNLFREQRMRLADSVSEFLKFAGRKPVTFYQSGTCSTIHELMEAEKTNWDARYNKESKQEFDLQVESEYRELLPWDDQFALDENTAEMLNWHLSLSLLVSASKDPALPVYLQRQFLLAAWTRAILLGNNEVADTTATDVIKNAPDMSALIKDYLATKSKEAKANAALFVLLKSPTLTPFLRPGLPPSGKVEDDYFQATWWCEPEDTEYDAEGNQVPKKVAAPSFLSAAALVTAGKERIALKALGNGKSFLGKRVLEWAKRDPDDPRIPEALFIGAVVNGPDRYGCGGYEQDEETREKLGTLLLEKYAGSEWANKWREINSKN